ncbi:MAG: HD domain protein [Firmicutes bacterium ADurb.Bin506]|jgi:metal-dependent HD superfamily phosphatase/phosphodiesterase|nr:MAG: HD domain protein [Firmicutes bacterium ADurb.Bin506]
MLSLKDIKQDPQIDAFMKRASLNLEAMGYTEHGYRHAGLVSSIAHNVLERLGYPPRSAELAGIAGYLHDIGNVVSRDHHGQSSAALVMPMLSRLGMDHGELAIIMAAVGNHEEEYGHPVNEVSAAVILADKSDVHRTRVRKKDVTGMDIHDRVSYAAERSFLDVDAEKKIITLNITIDITICPVMEYFEIFLTRMTMCRKAAQVLGCVFKIEINGAVLL